MSFYLLLLLVLVLFSLLAVAMRNLLIAAICLGVASVALTVVLFMLSAPWAAAFELSVCAGLITVLFVSAVSMIRKEELFLKEGRARFALLPLFLLFFGIGFWFFGDRLAVSLRAISGPGEWAGGVGILLWSVRSHDLLGQLCIILAGVLVIKAFFGRGRD